MERLERVIATLGTAGFTGSMWASLDALAGVDHYALIRFDGEQSARLVASASRTGLKIERAMQEEYIGHYHRFDPNRCLLRRHTASATLFSRIQRHQVPDVRYRLRCYDRPGLVDRISVVAEGTGSWYCLNLFRSRERGLFNACDEQAVRGAAALLAALTIKHDSIVDPKRGCTLHDRMAHIAARLNALGAALTPRELEVAVRIIAGMSTEGIGLDLDISANSVLTYRKRAYAKLAVSSQNQLFSLCM